MTGEEEIVWVGVMWVVDLSKFGGGDQYLFYFLFLLPSQSATRSK